MKIVFCFCAKNVFEIEKVYGSLPFLEMLRCPVTNEDIFISDYVVFLRCRCKRYWNVERLSVWCFKSSDSVTISPCFCPVPVDNNINRCLRNGLVVVPLESRIFYELYFPAKSHWTVSLPSIKLSFNKTV